MIDDYVNDIVNECVPPKKYSHEWDANLLTEKLNYLVNVSINIIYLAFYWTSRSHLGC